MFSIYLSKTVDDARQLLKYVDPTLGVPLPEKDYGGNCLIYDPDMPDNPLHNFWVISNRKSDLKKCNFK